MRTFTLQQDGVQYAEGIVFGDGSVVVNLDSGLEFHPTGVDAINLNGGTLVYTDSIPEVWDGGTP